MRKSFLAFSLAAAGLAVLPATAVAQSPAQSEHGVIGAVDGTTAVAAADRFREIRTAEVSGSSIEGDIHDDWGVYTSGTAVTGQDAVQSVYSDLAISNDTLYAPTMKAPGSCVELVTAYFSGAAQVWAWDWCDGVKVAKSVTVDGSFRDNYGTSVNGHDSYRGKVEQTDSSNNTWTASLFNYRTGSWDSFYSQSGTDQSHEDRSWNIFEIYASGDQTAEYCSALGGRAIESTGYQIKLDGGWHAADGGNTSVRSNSSAEDFLCPGLSRTVLHENDQWSVRH
ncbi:carbohydrate-binding protein [Amycolatopsis jiangsuensis]|uniref:Uncharacterized protein n=1 Tax=Amycolatopsis jiangsuensis TaxID=1181879 RepID=A0A840J5X0_9PSEU|nr:carbohydrate-binding protein [Amycolatopsis jiangsuensis]MBB4689183.1 hypothetical protein [Amycolatopsis jiangsuensis]